MNRPTLLCLVAASLVPVPLGAQSRMDSTSAPFQWVMQNSGTTAGLRGIDSTDGRVAWASGTEGTILRTTDGGEHWTRCATPDADKDGATLDFRGIQAWDAQTAIVMASGPGDKSRLYETADGCATWTLVLKNPDSPEGFFDSFRIEVGGTGLLVGDPVNKRFTIFWTSDHGHHWKRDPSSDLVLESPGIVAFAASNSLVLHTSGRSGEVLWGFASGGDSSMLYIHSEDNACTMLTAQLNPELCKSMKRSAWHSIGVPLAHGAASSGIFSVASRPALRTPASPAGSESSSDTEIWLAVGGDYSRPASSAGVAAWSDDEGQTWFAAKKAPHGYRSSVQWSSFFNAWITAGTNGSDFSDDDGYTWQSIDDGNWNALSLPFVVGPKGRIARLSTAVPK